MADSVSEIARDLVVAALSNREYVDADEVANMYKTVLKAVKESAGFKIPTSDG
ncbi:MULTISPECIES: hypothetical protein [Stenotrophomonas]|uniref:hypothetical protein n=1 Tax=Stenotrophomonas TaxID=40323 RepID=UPI0013DAE93A|nr:hypothetical protein [Stenotrophomonas geniculata]MDH7550169.1 hypothetical protein [Stenotrophomonas geniculata]